MLRDTLSSLLSGLPYQDFRFQVRLGFIFCALFLFIIPSLIGVNLFTFDLLTGAGIPALPEALDPFVSWLGDAAAREVIYSLFLAVGITMVLAACQDEPRLAPVLSAMGLLLVLYSIFFLLVASDTCIPNLGCSREFFFTATGMSMAFGFAGLVLPLRRSRFTGWLSLAYLGMLVYESAHWLVMLARTPHIELTWETLFAILLVFFTMVMTVLTAVVGFNPRRSA